MIRRLILPALLLCLALTVAMPATAQAPDAHIDLITVDHEGLLTVHGAEGMPMFLFDIAGGCAFAGVVEGPHWHNMVHHVGPDHTGVVLRGDLGGQFIELAGSEWDTGGSW